MVYADTFWYPSDRNMTPHQIAKLLHWDNAVQTAGENKRLFDLSARDVAEGRKWYSVLGHRRLVRGRKVC